VAIVPTLHSMESDLDTETRQEIQSKASIQSLTKAPYKYMLHLHHKEEWQAFFSYYRIKNGTSWNSHIDRWQAFVSYAYMIKEGDFSEQFLFSFKGMTLLHLDLRRNLTKAAIVPHTSNMSKEKLVNYWKGTRRGRGDQKEHEQLREIGRIMYNSLQHSERY